MNKIIKDIKEALSADTKTKAYDTQAKVIRDDGSTLWVHIPGGVDETPVKKTISAKVGDTVQLRVGGGSAWLVGNQSAPPTDDARAIVAETTAITANENAKVAAQAANSAVESAERASSAATRAEASASNALTAAQSAQTSADSALVSLSTVEDVVGVLNWITAHGTMTLTSDVAINPAHVYFVVDPTGDYVVGGTHYSIVAEPKVEDISTYYELSVDESVQNYVATHVVVDTEGLWLIPDSGGNKVLIATGAGSSYTTAGTYIIGKVSGVDTVFAKFTTDGVTMNATNSTQIAHLGYGDGNADTGTSYTPYFTFGERKTTTSSYSSSSTYAVGDLCVHDSQLYVCIAEITTAEAWNASHWALAIGNYSVSEGWRHIASGSNSHAEGQGNIAIGVHSHVEGHSTLTTDEYAHAEGWSTEANGSSSHAEGYNTEANAFASHAEGNGTTASGGNSHAEGQGTTASGGNSHAEGLGTTASGSGSHAEGADATASGDQSHAEGVGVTASGKLSHAQNNYTIAQGDNQTALGKFNVADTTSAVVIGNGTADNARSNALTVDWSGNVNIASGAKYKINGTDLSASDVGAVPTSRTVNSKALSSNITLSASDVSALPISGGTMTGQLLTSYKTSVAMGSYGSAQTTVPNLVDEVRFSSGCCGSASIGTAYTANNVTIATGWYNFMYMPHRSGGVNGSASGDNCNYGNLFLFGMNNTNGRFIVRVSSGSIAEVAQLYTSIERYTRSNAGTLDWSSQADGDAKVIMKSALAFWNGAYNGTGSNLRYSANGEIIGTNTSPSTITVSASSTTTGTLSSSTCRQYGKVVYLTLSIKNTSAVASGSNFYSATLSTSVPAPVAQCNGSSFYAGRAIGGYIVTSRNVVIRNSSGSSVTLGSADTINMSFTYITA